MAATAAGIGVEFRRTGVSLPLESMPSQILLRRSSLSRSTMSGRVGKASDARPFIRHARTLSGVEPSDIVVASDCQPPSSADVKREVDAKEEAVLTVEREELLVGWPGTCRDVMALADGCCCRLAREEDDGGAGKPSGSELVVREVSGRGERG